MGLIFNNDKNQQRRFTAGLINQIRSKYRTAYPRIKSVVKKFLADELRNQFYLNGTVESIKNGILKGELGIQQPEVALEDILTKMITTINVEVSAPRETRRFLVIKVTAVRSDFLDLLGLASASQEWTDRRGITVKGPPLPWLEWLLFEGNELIIRDYSVTDRKGLGRSDEHAVMERGEGGWRVPKEYQGTSTDNFILDIVGNVRRTLDKKLWQIVRPVIAQLS